MCTYVPMPTCRAGTCTSAMLVHERSHLAKVKAVRITTTDDLGRYLRERRRNLGLTQSHLAARAKVSRRWLSDLEAGKQRAEFGLVIQTLHALGMIIDLQPEESTGQINLDDFLDQRRTR